MSRSRSIVVAECVVVPVMSDSMSESVSETVRVRVSVPRLAPGFRVVLAH